MNGGIYLKRVNKGVVQMPLQHWPGQGIEHHCRNPVPGLECPSGKEIFPQWSPNLPWGTQLWAIPMCPDIGCHRKGISTVLSAFASQKAGESNEEKT